MAQVLGSSLDFVGGAGALQSDKAVEILIYRG